jgi:hypothetical protein
MTTLVKTYLQKNIRTVQVVSPSYLRDLAAILAYLRQNGVVR